MNFDRSLIFSYLEEDNIQRAYFRVRPLLTLEGDVQQEAVQLWPNEGGLRIVPDRNEQHTFKSRMRNLGAFCVVDLRNLPVEAGKIRTNKNYRPDRGEVNQYILYSDTVHELPEHTFYQLMDGAAADYAALAEQAVTPLFYIREGDTLYGPVRKASPALPETAKEAAGVLFELSCPDHVSRMILCLEDEPAKSAAEPAPAVKTELPAQLQSMSPVLHDVEKPSQNLPKDEALPIGEALQILDATKTTEDTLKQLDKPVSAGANLLNHREPKRVQEQIPAPGTGSLSGTPLVRTPLRVSVQQNKNRMQEVVANQWNVGKYEPPVPNLPVGASLRTVQNPVETACQRLREAWNASSAHDQLIDCMLSLDGVRGQLEAKLCNGSSETIMQHVLRDRLHDLEAERLSALCELDKARRDVDAYKQELINGLASRIARETERLEADKAQAESLMIALKAEVNHLTLQRDALLDKVHELQSSILPEAVAKLLADTQMAAPVAGTPLRLSPISGEHCDLEALIARISGVCKAVSVQVERNQIIAALVLFSISARIGISCPTPAPVTTLLKKLAAALGWQHSYAHQISHEQHPVLGLRPVDATPAVLATSVDSFAPIQGVTKLTIARSAAPLTHNAAYEANPWPVLMLPVLPFIPELDAGEVAPISASSVAQLAQKRAATDAELNAVLTPLLKAANPLSGSACKELYHFVSVCAGLMEGGLPVAVDWGILLWIIPALERESSRYPAVKALLDEYPLSQSILE